MHAIRQASAKRATSPALFFLETGSHFVTLVVLELVLNFQLSFSFCFPSAAIFYFKNQNFNKYLFFLCMDMYVPQ